MKKLTQLISEYGVILPDLYNKLPAPTDENTVNTEYNIYAYKDTKELQEAFRLEAALKSVRQFVALFHTVAQVSGYETEDDTYTLFSPSDLGLFTGGETSHTIFRIAKNATTLGMHDTRVKRYVDNCRDFILETHGYDIFKGCFLAEGTAPVVPPENLPTFFKEDGVFHKTISGYRTGYGTYTKATRGYVVVDGTYWKEEDTICYYDLEGRSKRILKNSPKAEGLFFNDGKYFDFDPTDMVRVFSEGTTLVPRNYKGYWFSPELNRAVSDDWEIFSYGTCPLKVLDKTFLSEPDERVVTGSKNYSDNTLFLGVELEVEISDTDNGGTGLALSVCELMEGKAITTHDGSLDYGFEIVSVPATLAHHYGMWENLLRRSGTRSDLRSYDTETCGIHIHMSKEAFSPLVLGKFISFINSERNREFVEKIAQRSLNEYCQPAYKIDLVFGKYRNVNKGRFEEDSCEELVEMTDDRYSAVNLLNPNTVELRIFRGTLHYPSFMKNLEFCHALHSWCKSLESSMHDLHYSKFVAYVSKHRKAYTYLYDYLIRRGFVQTGNSINPHEAGTESSTTPPKRSEKYQPIPEKKLMQVRMASISQRTGTLV